MLRLTLPPTSATTPPEIGPNREGPSGGTLSTYYTMVISMQPLENEVTHPSATFCMCGHFSASQTGSSAAGQQ
jgi:hypothetical protein